MSARRNGHKKGRFEGNGGKPVPQAVWQATPAPQAPTPTVETEEDTEHVMEEWLNVCAEVKERLRDGRHLQDPCLPQERELGFLLDVIHDSFRFWDGSVPNDLSTAINPEAISPDMLWNFAEFAQMVAKRAYASRLQRQKFMREAFIPLLNHEESAGSKVFARLLGQEFLNQGHVRESVERLQRPKQKGKVVDTKQEREDPLELVASVERSSTER